MCTLIGGGADGPVGLARELGAYLTATFVRLDFGEEALQGQTFTRTRGALQVVEDGLWPDVQLTLGALVRGCGRSGFRA